jgi:putative flavoprotein involved in K+ transport
MADVNVDVMVVGAGHAGLSASYFLKQHGIKHVVLEKGKIGESWRAQRWDSFKLNTANKLNGLPGRPYQGNNEEGFSSSRDFIKSLEDYVSTFALPVVENAAVVAIEKPEDSDLFKAMVHHNNTAKIYTAKKVILTSGDSNKKKLPAFAASISDHIKQFHTSEYRNPQSLPEGDVLVVGSGQSGCQITEDLLEKGKKVFLSTSLVPRIPRRYRGKDIMDWLIETRFMDVKTHEVPDPKMLRMRVPLLSGIGTLGHTISLQGLARKGAILLGKMENADEKNAHFQDNAAMHVKFADGFSEMVKTTIDEFILNNQLTSPPRETDEDDRPDTDASGASSVKKLDLQKNNITSIIWATGFSADFSYLKLPVTDHEGNLKHKNGIMDVDGLYLLGYHWLRNRKSTLIYGIQEDAEFIVEEVRRSLQIKNKVTTLG